MRPQPGLLPGVPRSGIIAPRAASLRKGTEGWLALLTARLPYMPYSPQPRPDGLRDYRALLAHALADGRIVGDEATQLAVLAARAGLTQTTTRQVHEEFLAEARARAEADGVVMTAELRELQRAAKERAASHLISDLEEAAAANRAKSNGPLKSWRIMPVGDSAGVTEVVDLAVKHGAKVAVNVTKTMRLVICEVAAENDPRVAKALAPGTDVLPPDRARKLPEDEIAKIHGGLFADRSGEQDDEVLPRPSAGSGRPAFLHDPADGLDRADPATHAHKLEVDRRDVDDLQTFGQGEHGRIDVAEWGRHELPHQVCRAATIVVGRANDVVVRPGARHGVEKLQLKCRTVADVVAQEVAGLPEHRFRDQESSGPLGQQPNARRVVTVSSVEARNERTGVAKQLPHALRRMLSIASTISRSRRASAMISRYRADRSCSPVLTSPTHGKRRRTGP